MLLRMEPNLHGIVWCNGGASPSILGSIFCTFNFCSDCYFYVELHVSISGKILNCKSTPVRRKKISMNL